MTEAEMAALDRENMAVLSATQAALGNISPYVRAVFVDAKSEQIVLHFVVAEGRAEACQEDIDDTVSEFTAGTLGDQDLADVTAEVHIEEVPRDWTSRGWRPVYWAKGWSAWRE
jgi:hypothetical protein